MLKSIEAQLLRDGVDFTRDLCFYTGEWVFIVDGELVATGSAIGTLEMDLIRWWNNAVETYRAVRSADALQES
jgi:hypothetical protein